MRSRVGFNLVQLLGLIMNIPSGICVLYAVLTSGMAVLCLGLLFFLPNCPGASQDTPPSVPPSAVNNQRGASPTIFTLEGVS